jgi:hypothetical protein
MKRLLTTLAVAALVVFPVTPVGAQSDNDYSAWFALITTPVGALVPTVVTPTIKRELTPDTKTTKAWAFNLSRWKFDESSEDPVYNLGGTFMSEVGRNAILGGTLGYAQPTCSGCDGWAMAGADLHSAVWESAAGRAKESQTIFTVVLKGSLGISQYLGEGSGNSMSVAGSVPLVMRMDQPNGSSFAAFLSPGWGFGRVSSSGESESGTRPMVSGGISWTTVSGVGLNFGIHKVLIDDPSGVFPMNMGIAVTTSR